MAALIGHLWVWQSLLGADLIRKALVSIMLDLIDTNKWIATLLDKYEVSKEKVAILCLYVHNSISLGYFDCYLWKWQILLGDFFCNDKWNNLTPLIWCFVFTHIFSRKNTDTEYCYFSTFQIEYWYWYFSILKQTEYWILVLLFCTGQCIAVFSI